MSRKFAQKVKKDKSDTAPEDVRLISDLLVVCKVSYQRTRHLSTMNLRLQGEKMNICDLLKEVQDQ